MAWVDERAARVKAGEDYQSILADQREYADRPWYEGACAYYDVPELLRLLPKFAETGRDLRQQRVNDAARIPEATTTSAGRAADQPDQRQRAADAVVAAAQPPEQAPVVSGYPVAIQDVALVVEDSVPAAEVQAALVAGAASAAVPAGTPVAAGGRAAIRRLHRRAGRRRTAVAGVCAAVPGAGPDADG